MKLLNQNIKPLTAMAGILIFASIGCAKPEKQMGMQGNHSSYLEESEGKSITSSAVREVDGKDFVEIEFIKNENILSESAKGSIRNLITRTATGASRIDEVLVLSWADDEYPSKNLKKLSPDQITLADDRNKVIKDYIRSLKSVDIEQYNLARQPRIFSKWFNTNDAKLKQSLVSAGLPTTADELKYPSKASHAVVIIKTE